MQCQFRKFNMLMNVYRRKNMTSYSPPRKLLGDITRDYNVTWSQVFAFRHDYANASFRTIA